MENYENLGTIGEGTYGVVLKCRHKETGQIVAIKKFKESDEDEQVRKTALREVRILKQLKHDNIVNLIEVFRRKGKLYLVFEYVDRTILEDLEKHPEGLGLDNVKKITWQLCRAIEFCHAHNVIHRDIKPENLLVSKHGALKLCDFGFARTLAGPKAKYTDYVSTRWYRSPELLVGDTSYGKGVDVWAIGSMVAEITNGMPLFPGESDVDQLFHIVRCFGRLTDRQMELFRTNPLFVGVNMPDVSDNDLEPLRGRFPNIEKSQLEVMSLCLDYDPDRRATCTELMSCSYFDGFEEQFAPELDKALRLDGNEFAMKRKRRNRRGRGGERSERGERVGDRISSRDEQSERRREREESRQQQQQQRGRSIERGDGREGPLRAEDDNEGSTGGGGGGGGERRGRARERSVTREEGNSSNTGNGSSSGNGGGRNDSRRESRRGGRSKSRPRSRSQERGQERGRSRERGEERGGGVHEENSIVSNNGGERGSRRSRRNKGASEREPSVERQKRKADKREKSRRERSIDRRTRAEAGQSGLDGGDSFISLGDHRESKNNMGSGGLGGAGGAGGGAGGTNIDIKEMGGDIIIDGFGGGSTMSVMSTMSTASDRSSSSTMPRHAEEGKYSDNKYFPNLPRATTPLNGVEEKTSGTGSGPGTEEFKSSRNGGGGGVVVGWG